MKYKLLILVVLVFSLASCQNITPSTPEPLSNPEQAHDTSLDADEAMANRPPGVDDYCADTPIKIANKIKVPEPFLYLPVKGSLSIQNWTAQMDHDTPNYEQNGVMASLGEVMSFDTAGLGLMGGTEVYQNPGNLWFNSTKTYNEILAMGYSVLAYESPSLETFIYYDGHDGHDFAQSGAALAAGDGTVVFKGDYNDSLGLVVEIFHPQGYLTRYAHLATFESNLDIGTSVTAGQPIGTIGGSAIVDGTVIKDYWGTHLHFSVFRWNGDKWNIVDPFGWDPWAGPDEKSRIRKQQEDPLIQCNGEISYSLWVGGWPRNFDASVEVTAFGPTEDRYIGGWLGQMEEIEVLPSFPNGQIAYMKDGDIFLFDFLTQEDTQITFTGNNHDPDWSFDGEYILYIHGEGKSASIVVLDSSREQIASFPARAGKWTPHSYDIIWINQAHDAFYRSAFDGSEARREYENISLPDPSGAVWDDFSVNPWNYVNVSVVDSSRLEGFFRQLAKGWESFYEIYTAPEFEGVRPLNCMFSLDSSHSGLWAFVVDSLCMGWAPGARHIYVFGEPARYLNVYGDEPSWSPDENFLVYRYLAPNTDLPGLSYQGIAVVNLQTDEVTNVINHPDAQQPAWRP